MTDETTIQKARAYDRIQKLIDRADPPYGPDGYTPQVSVSVLRAAMHLEDPTVTDTSNQRFYRLILTGDPTWPYGLRGPDCNRDTPVTRDSPCFSLEGVHRACNDYGNKEIAIEFYESAHYHHNPAPLVDETDEDG